MCSARKTRANVNQDNGEMPSWTAELPNELLYCCSKERDRNNQMVSLRCFSATRHGFSHHSLRSRISAALPARRDRADRKGLATFISPSAAGGFQLLGDTGSWCFFQRFCRIRRTAELLCR
ncbi:hypothetical protein PHSY_006352 [Pseudozyma hubeiensis SY62]|uniref:Uncharacterized protein n=1 Tax=Pseudozyma hubeiensis (strain SY62) TaxID=1305764 RepID=R9PBH8_PSEHS|nr:hypothetical protein PHSY_006352 [Pseudozyma hubeiensis SY62]GAC98758.1 hypothetical protein PHSY_006352 [Pseudozyma hubeiensis SY62]